MQINYCCCCCCCCYRVQSISVLGRVHTVPEEFEKAGFTLKTHQRFSVLTTPEEFENTTITSYFGFVFD